MLLSTLHSLLQTSIAKRLLPGLPQSHARSTQQALSLAAVRTCGARGLHESHAQAKKPGSRHQAPREATAAIRSITEHT